MSPKLGIDLIGIAVVFFCHDTNGNFVMNKRGPNCRDEQGRWEVGGGALEFGENVISRLKTEVKEEYGCDVLDHRFLGYRDVHRMQNNQNTHWVTLDFSVLIDPAQVKNGEAEKFDEVRLVKLDALPSPLHSQASGFFSVYKNKLF